ncbi:uncharacterized protein LOC119617498 [Kryptolebias marmoratus]|uniref:uncharacterized protein LOC119617498 n=1 Tax=Kryptolebias marmoratus TaxID=37003 RepID=UPI0018ACB6E8|nr:uncharacterized protein LOC119617498 [Kryptolebias marmoratus]
MTSEDVMATTKRVFISSPKKYIKGLSEAYKLDHGLLITELNPIINEGYLEAYFWNLGFRTICKMWKFHSSESSVTVAFVRFPTEDEADEGDWVGPHYIAGVEVTSRRIVSPKIKDESEEEIKAAFFKRPARHPVGLGYVLEEPQWIPNEDVQSPQKVIL